MFINATRTALPRRPTHFFEIMKRLRLSGFDGRAVELQVRMRLVVFGLQQLQHGALHDDVIFYSLPASQSNCT